MTAWTSSYGYTAAAVTVFTLCFVFASVVAGFHLYMMLTRKDSSQDHHTGPDSSKDLAIRAIFWGTNTSVFFFWTMIVVAMIYRFRDIGLLPFKQFCNEYVILLLVLWLIGKTAMFFVFITRIYASFKGSAYQLSGVLFALISIEFTRLGILSLVDSAVNLTCTVMMTHNWSGVYWWVYSPLLKCLIHHTHCLDQNEDYKWSLSRLIEYHAQHGIAEDSRTQPDSQSPSAPQRVLSFSSDLSA